MRWTDDFWRFTRSVVMGVWSDDVMQSKMREPNHPEAEAKPTKGSSVRLILLLIVLVIAVVFAAQNADVVTLRVLAWRFDASLAVIIVLCFAAGALVSLFTLLPHIYRRRSDQHRLRARISDLETETAAGKSSTMPPPTNAGDSNDHIRQF